jgi:hypothetical protein
MKQNKEAEEGLESMDNEMDMHKLNCDIDILQKAKKMMKNKKHMKKLHAHAAEKMEAFKGIEMEDDSDDEEVSSIKDIRKKANKKAEE